MYKRAIAHLILAVLAVPVTVHSIHCLLHHRDLLVNSNETDSILTDCDENQGCALCDFTFAQYPEASSGTEIRIWQTVWERKHVKPSQFRVKSEDTSLFLRAPPSGS